MNTSQEKKIAITLLEVLSKAYGTNDRQPQDIIIERDVSFVDLMVIHLLQPEEHPDRVLQAYQGLKKEFVDWNEVRISHSREIYELLAKYLQYHPYEKAQRLREMLSLLFPYLNTMKLDFLWAKTPAEIQKLLHPLGIEQEMVKNIILHVYAYNTIPIHSQSLRVAKLLGLPDKELLPAVDEQLHDLRPHLNDLIYLYKLFFLHSQHICLPVNRNCKACVIAKHCRRGGLKISSPKKGAANSTNKKTSSKKIDSHKEKKAKSSLKPDNKSGLTKKKPAPPVKRVSRTSKITVPKLHKDLTKKQRQEMLKNSVKKRKPTKK